MTQLGNLHLDAPFFQAGLAGYSDTAMRLMARRHGAPLAVTEAMLDVLLLNGGKGLQNAQLHPDDHPIAGQLMGSCAPDMAKAAHILLDLGYDLIDVNLACPVKKIRKRSRGGHLLAFPQEARDILQAVRQAVPASIPCTVKLRRGTDDSAQAENNFRLIFESAIELGYAAAVVHGRSVAQKYQGLSNWNWLAQLTAQYKNARPGFVIGGSGDIWKAQDIFRMIRATGVQLVSVARGCIGNPWIFHQARALMRGDEAAALLPPTIAQQRQVLLEHFHLSAQIHGEFSASLEMRKFGIKFSRHHPRKTDIARAFISVKSFADWQAVVHTFYADDGPGICADMQQAALPQWSCEEK